MGVNVPPRDVGQTLLIIISIIFENQDGLLSQRPIAEPSASMINAEFERHVHARKFALTVRLATAKIMDAIFGPANKLDDAVQPIGGIVGILRRKARIKAEVRYAEGDSLKDWRELVIKGAVDENRPLKWRQTQPLGGCGSLP